MHETLTVLEKLLLRIGTGMCWTFAALTVVAVPRAPFWWGGGVRQAIGHPNVRALFGTTGAFSSERTRHPVTDTP
jgi:hypothetical protein